MPSQLLNELNQPRSITAKPKRRRPQSNLVFQRADEIEPRRVKWLIQGVVPFGKLTVLAGDPGSGKSTLGLGLAAIATATRRFPPYGTRTSLCEALILSAEDDLADTVRPRLEAAGADLRKCLFPKFRNIGRPFNLIKDFGRLRRRLVQHPNVKLLIIDPLSACLSGTDIYRETEVRDALALLLNLASKRSIAVVAISHLNKSSNKSAMARIMGSRAIPALARVAFLVAPDPVEDRRLLLPIKHNLSADEDGFEFRIEAVTTHKGIIATRIAWGPKLIHMSADEALKTGAKGKRRDALAEAEAFYREHLKDGSVSSTNLEERAKRAGISQATLRRARKRMGLKRSKIGMRGGWLWRLPEEAQLP